MSILANPPVNAAAMLLLTGLSACTYQAKRQPTEPPATEPTRTASLQNGELRSANGRLSKRWTYYLGEHGEQVLEGVETSFNDDGAVILEVPYHHGQRDGIVTWYNYYSPNAKSSQETWVDGEQCGPSLKWHPNRQLSVQSSFEHGPQVGIETRWDDNGHKTAELAFDQHGHKIEETDWDSNGNKQFHCTYGQLPPPQQEWPEVQNGDAIYWNQTGHEVAKGIWRDGQPWDGVCGVLTQHGSLNWFEFGEYQAGQFVKAVPDPLYPADLKSR